MTKHILDQLVSMATSEGATVIRAPGSTIIVIPAQAADGDDLLPEREAATLARCSVRTLRAAVRAGELAAYGRQRSRTVRRASLRAWIESRRVQAVEGPADDDIDRRILRLQRRSA
jgi:hypothetical protein